MHWIVGGAVCTVLLLVCSGLRICLGLAEHEIAECLIDRDSGKSRERSSERNGCGIVAMSLSSLGVGHCAIFQESRIVR